jgi:hypothetical protein
VEELDWRVLGGLDCELDVWVGMGGRRGERVYLEAGEWR